MSGKIILLGAANIQTIFDISKQIAIYSTNTGEDVTFDGLSARVPSHLAAIEIVVRAEI